MHKDSFIDTVIEQVEVGEYTVVMGASYAPSWNANTPLVEVRRDGGTVMTLSHIDMKYIDLLIKRHDDREDEYVAAALGYEEFIRG